MGLSHAFATVVSGCIRCQFISALTCNTDQADSPYQKGKGKGKGKDAKAAKAKANKPDAKSSEKKTEKKKGKKDEVPEPPAWPSARRWTSACAINESRWLMFGGQAADNTLLNDLWIYDTASGIWTTLPEVRARL